MKREPGPESLAGVGRVIAEDAIDLARQIVVRWSELASQEPWLEHLTHLRQDNLPDLIRALAGAALIEPEGTRSAAELIEQARQHGLSRREDGYDEGVLPAEYILLRRSIRHILIQERDMRSKLLLQTIALLEIGIGLAEVAALHGYHEKDEGASVKTESKLLREWSGLFHEVLDRD